MILEIPEIVNILKSFLLPIELIDIKSCSQSFYDGTDILIRTRFENFIKFRFGEVNANAILSSLANDNCVISGSFMLQFLLNENYEHSDIDLYSTPEHSSALFKKLEDEGEYYEALTDDNPRLDQLVRLAISFYRRDGDCEDSVKSIQVIVCNDIHKIIERFDFNICKCVYYGNQIRIYDLESIKCKNEVLDMLVNEISPARILKYRIRGFTFYPPADPDMARKDTLDFDLMNQQHQEDGRSILENQRLKSFYNRGISLLEDPINLDLIEKDLKRICRTISNNCEKHYENGALRDDVIQLLNRQNFLVQQQQELVLLEPVLTSDKELTEDISDALDGERNVLQMLRRFLEQQNLMLEDNNEIVRELKSVQLY